MFAHHTVKQFLLDSLCSSPVVDPIKFTLQEAEYIVGEACVTYLCFSDFETQLLKKEYTTISVKPGWTQGMLRSAIPFGSTLSRFIPTLYWGNNRGTRSLVSFDVPLGPPSGDLERAYHLLKYVVPNWHYHTSQFIPTQPSTTWAKFRNLTFEHQLTFDARPWTDSSWRIPYREPSLPHLSLFHWAVDQNLAAFLHLLADVSRQSLHSYIDYDLAIGRNPLMQACQKGSAASLECLLAQDLKYADDSNLTILAAKEGHETVVKLLLERNDAYIDSKDSIGRTPLSWAAGNGHEHVVKLLLKQKNVSVNSKDYSLGQTPLAWAAKHGHEGLVKLLLERRDIEADRKDNEGLTPLMWAALQGYNMVVKLLVGRSDVNNDSKDVFGRTPLSYAASSGIEDIVTVLLEHKDVNPDSRDDKGQTPLSWAADFGHEGIVKLLLESGKVDPNTMDNSGQTPLQRAVNEGHENVCKILNAWS